MISPSIRVHISKEYRTIYEQLAKRGNDDPENFPFPTMKDVFMMAATIGVKKNKFKKLVQPDSIFPCSVLDQKNDIPVLAAMAFAHTSTFEVLFDDSQMIKIAEGYANGGILEMQRELIGRSGKNIDNVLNFILNVN